jgi:hypothetical protein
MILRRTSYKPERNDNRRLTLIIAAAVAGLVVVIGLIILLTSGRNLKDSITKTVYNATDTVITQKNGVLHTDSDNLVFYDYFGKQIWNKKMFAADVKVTSSDTLIAVFNTNMVQLFDLDGNQFFSKELTGDILNAKCGIDKVAVITEVQTEEEGKQKFLLIFNTKGEQLDNIPFNTQHIIDIGFYGKSSQLWVLTLDAAGVIPISRIATYNPGVSMTGIIDINGQLVDKLIIDENSIYASGTTNLSIYNLFGEKQDSLLVYGWYFHGEYISDGRPVFIYVPRNAVVKNRFDSLRIIKINKSGNTDLTINLPPDILKACIYNSKLYCFSQNNLYKYTLEGKLEDKYDLPYAIDGVFRVYENHAFIIKSADVFALPLP